MTSQPAAGWYTQPDGTQRFWNGSSWSEQPVQDRISASGYRTGYPTAPPPYQGTPQPPWQTGPAQSGWGAPYPTWGVRPVAAKNGGIALLGSFFIPGLGQFINGDTGKGVAFLLSWIVSIVLIWVLVGLLTLPVVWVWSMIDAYTSAQRWNREHGILA